MITGGSGFFGQAFAQYLLQNNLSDRICIYSRDEYKQSLMRERFQDSRLRFFIGDVRDADRLRHAMKGVSAVVHAAALKRIEVGAYNPEEMIKTNVIGSMNVVQACADVGAGRAVLISSDKAFQPISPYGQSKALAESLFLSANATHGRNGPRYAVCRYGNVAGSTGSVIPTWRRILQHSDTVPISHPNVTRFWMTIHEAVQLVANTLAEMPKEVVIPTLPAYRLEDLADAMGAKNAEFTSLKPYEKMHESMREGESSETARRMSVNELIWALRAV